MLFRSTVDGTHPAYLPGQVDFGTDVRIKAIAAGRLHALAVDTDGYLWTWGYNGNGQLGDGTLNSRALPARVSGTSTATYACSVCGASYDASKVGQTCTVVTDTTTDVDGNTEDVYCTGTVEEKTTTTQFGNLQAVAAGDDFSMALDIYGQVWA